MSEPVNPEELQSIAVIGGNDEETRMIVENVLEAISIPSFIEGSTVYAIQVYHRDSDRARNALKTDPRLEGKWIVYSE